MAKKKKSSPVKRPVKPLIQKMVEAASSMPSDRAPFQALTVLEITKPLAGDIVKVTGGQIAASVVDSSATFTDVWAKVYAEGDTPDSPSGNQGPANSGHLTTVSGNLHSGNVPVDPAITGNDLKIVAWARNPANDTWSEPTTNLFTRATSTAVPVPATACLWFAWTNEATGPWSEPIAGHRPVSIAVPAGVNKVEITAATGSWRHDPADSAASGPAGRDALDQVRQGYKDLAPNVVPLPDAACRLNLLVGMWTFINGGVEEQAGQEFAIGAGIDINIPTSLTRTLTTNSMKLYLGFHDGYQWNNNTGSVSPEVKFYTER